jgi:hypothetical protein
MDPVIAEDEDTSPEWEPQARRSKWRATREPYGEPVLQTGAGLGGGCVRPSRRSFDH